MHDLQGFTESLMLNFEKGGNAASRRQRLQAVALTQGNDSARPAQIALLQGREKPACSIAGAKEAATWRDRLQAVFPERF